MEFERDYQGIQKALLSANQVLITTHKSPDGDAIGSSLAMHHYLTSQGIKHTMVVPDEWPHFLNWLDDTDSIIRFDQDEARIHELIAQSDVLLSLDYNVLSRAGKGLESALSHFKGTRIMIDHHRQPDETYDFYVHDVTSCSTAQLVAEFIMNTTGLGNVGIPLAESLYTGILTDTGSFRFPSTSSQTHRIVADLMEQGLDVTKVYNAIYDTNSFNRLKLLGYVLGEKMVLHQNKTTAYFTLSLKELNQHGYQPGDTEGFVNYALSISGVKFACIMKEAANGTKMSFRSKGDWDVNTFARTHFNGGGHLNAAGGFSSLSLEETETAFLNCLNEYKQELNS